VQERQGLWHYIFVMINGKLESPESLPGNREPVFEQSASEL
jgi:hypothetical protein